MAAKEESVILKYLKKNPESEALDISFGTDIDESVVKEVLQQLLAKQEVAVTISDSNVATWKTATPPKPVPAPKPEKPAKVAKEPSFEPEASSDDDEAPKSGGSGKGFVIVVALIFALISVGASYFLAQGKIAAGHKESQAQITKLTDSLGGQFVTLTGRITALEAQVKKLTAPPAEEKPEAKAPKAAAKAPKGKKKKH